ncbi:MAG: SAF domain-containing protein [Clostridiales Family XIII bacterium]|nr:SAF domain-containing protein [Clostridiales Family XIII bacterium]
MKRWRLFAGILLVILAVAGLAFWETAGRSRLLMDRVVVASADIRAGTVLRADMLTTVLIPNDGVIATGFSSGRETEIVGKRTALPISARQQISSDIFMVEDDYMKGDESFFVIPAEWIAMRSSALRRGDTVEITPASGEKTSFGRYKLAFVKDEDEIEVRDMPASGELLFEALERRERTDANAVIDHVEIIATRAAYESIRVFAENAGSPALLIIQRGDAG